VSTAVIHRYRFDDLRRFAAALGTASGLIPARALALASHLLWFDAAGAASSGIATLPAWLEAIDVGRVDPKATGRVIGERAALAIFDGENGVPPLLLERAAELAVEKARETAVGLVRVAHLGALRSAAAVTAGIAVGPMAGLVLGPNRLWSMAVPSDSGLPVVVDSGLSAALGTGTSGAPQPQADSTRHPASGLDESTAAVLEGLVLGAEVFVPGDSWVVAAVAVSVLEPLTTFHQRVATALRGLTQAPGRLLPDAWDVHRRDSREHGVAIAAPAWKSLKTWAQRLAVDVPTPLRP
jgi:LDH2 family malate/lactate/ureidoglycolate dehydrogenase